VGVELSFLRTCSWATRASIRASAACLLFLAACAGEAAALLDTDAPVFFMIFYFLNLAALLENDATVFFILFSQCGGAPRHCRLCVSGMCVSMYMCVYMNMYGCAYM
jgi:hypothetical protein